MTTKISTREARQTILDRRDFTSHGALSGVTFEDSRDAWVGNLPMVYAKELWAVKEPVYVVYSYSTPIAWHTEKGGWVRPPVKYSVTTSRHQGQCPVTGTGV